MGSHHVVHLCIVNVTDDDYGGHRGISCCSTLLICLLDVSLIWLFISQGQRKAEEINPLVDSVLQEVRRFFFVSDDLDYKIK